MLRLIKFVAVFLLCCSAGLPATRADSIAEETAGDEPLLYLESLFFKDRDLDQDAQLSKKEFYYAIMEDAFEEMALKHSVSAVDLEFDIQDLDGDGYISFFEWKRVFIPDLPQEAEYVDGRTADAPNPPAPAPQPDPNAGQNIVVPGETMQLIGEKTMPDGRTFYMAEGGSWHRVEDFCKEKSSRLCRYDELCPDILSHHDDIFSKEEIRDRWVPVQGPAHEWMELRNCGMARWPEYHAHPSLITCCAEEDADKVKLYKEQLQRQAEEAEKARIEKEEKDKLAAEEAAKLEAERQAAEEKRKAEEDREAEEAERKAKAKAEMKAEKARLRAAKAAAGNDEAEESSKAEKSQKKKIEKPKIEKAKLEVPESEVPSASVSGSEPSSPSDGEVEPKKAKKPKKGGKKSKKKATTAQI